MAPIYEAFDPDESLYALADLTPAPTICTYCGTDLEGGRIESDHVRPRSWPDSIDGPANRVVSCQGCNAAKGGNDPVAWFFVLIRRDGAVLGRDLTVADVRLAHLWHRWGDQIRGVMP